MSESKPTSLEELDAKELYRSALEDFAIDVDKDDANKKKVLLAAFLESGVDWEDYVAQHPEVAPDEDEVKAAPENVVTVSKPAPVVKPDPSTLIVKEELPVTQQYLIKMVRDNLLFQTRGYTFTKEHPYAVVEGEDAQFILEHEDGFRQALPSELREFYG